MQVGGGTGGGRSKASNQSVHKRIPSQITASVDADTIGLSSIDQKAVGRSWPSDSS